MMAAVCTVCADRRVHIMSVVCMHDVCTALEQKPHCAPSLHPPFVPNTPVRLRLLFVSSNMSRKSLICCSWVSVRVSSSGWEGVVALHDTGVQWRPRGWVVFAAIPHL